MLPAQRTSYTQVPTLQHMILNVEQTPLVPVFTARADDSSHGGHNTALVPQSASHQRPHQSVVSHLPTLASTPRPSRHCPRNTPPNPNHCFWKVRTAGTHPSITASGRYGPPEHVPPSLLLEGTDRRNPSLQHCFWKVRTAVTHPSITASGRYGPPSHPWTSSSP